MSREIYLFSLTPAKQLDLHQISILKTAFHPFLLEPERIAVITSKEALKALHFYYPNTKLNVLTVGAKSAALAHRYGHTVLDATQRDAQALAQHITQHFFAHSLCYYRAKEVQTSLTDLVDNGIDIVERIVYSTQCNDLHESIDSDAILLFTSPKTTHCYFEHYLPGDSQQFVAIGPSTLSALQQYVSDAHMSDEPSVEALIMTAKRLQ